MMAAPDNQLAFLATAAASSRQRARAYAVLGVSALLFAIALPFATQRLAPVPAFIPAYQSALIVSDLITAVLLFWQFRILKRYALSVLAAGYLFTALMATAHALSFPGAFSPTGWLGSGAQSTAWLYMFWHGGFPLFVVAYVLMGDRGPAGQAVRRINQVAGAGALAVALGTIGLVALATAGESFLPAIMRAGTKAPTMVPVIGTVWLICFAALALLWRQRSRAVLDLWLIVVMCAWLFDIALSAVFNAGRFDLGFYAGRIYGLLAATYVLVELLVENGRLYAALVDLNRAQREQGVALELALDQAQAADRAKGQFLATMSHEIRTPMNAVIGLTHLALDTELTDRQRDYLTKVHKAGKSLLRLLDDILDYSKVEAGKLVLEREEFSPEEVVDAVGGLFAARIEEAGLDLFFDIGRDVPDRLVGDALRLSQVLGNLVGNAVKFTRQGQIVISVARVAHVGDGQDVRLRFEVSDTGIGLTQEQAAQLFKPFVQAEKSTSRQYGGTGLGLAICRRLVELMGGAIEVTSDPGRGSVFSFEASFGTAAPQPHRMDLHRIQGMRTLLVDPSNTSTNVLQEMLQSWGFRVSTAATSSDALNKLRAAEAGGLPFQLCVLDEKTTGIHESSPLAIKLRRAVHPMALDRLATVVTVSVSANERVLSLVDAVPADVVLTKPVTPSRLFDSIVRLQNPGARHVDTASSAKTTDYGEATRAIHGARVLLVEDNPINQQIASEFLSMTGMQVTLANNGIEAVDHVKSAPFDLALMDVQMPEMDGLQATRLIRGLPQGVTLPIIAMTASALEQDQQECSAAGMNAHIAKPVDPEELVATLLRWIPAIQKPAQQIVDGGVSTDATALAQLLPGIAVPDALERLAGNTRMYRNLLQAYATQHQSDGQRIETLCSTGKREELSRLLHSLASSSGMLGMVGITRSIRALEQALATPHSSSLDANVAAVRNAMELAFRELSKLSMAGTITASRTIH